MSKEIEEILNKYGPIMRGDLRKEFTGRTTRRTGRTNRSWRYKITYQFGDAQSLDLVTNRAAFILNNGLKAGKITPKSGKIISYTRKNEFRKAEGFIAAAIRGPVESMADEIMEVQADAVVNVPQLQ